MTKEEAIKEAADAVQEHADSGFRTDPHIGSDAIDRALESGATLDEIAAYNRARRTQSTT